MAVMTSESMMSESEECPSESDEADEKEGRHRCGEDAREPAGLCVYW
jgi:hypothetical protein